MRSVGHSVGGAGAPERTLQGRDVARSRGVASAVLGVAALAAGTFLVVVFAHVVMMDVGPAWGNQLALVLRAMGTTVAITAGVLKLASYVGKREPAYLIVGATFVGVGLIEGGRLVALLLASVNDTMGPLLVVSRGGWAAAAALPILLLLGMILIPADPAKRRTWSVNAFLATVLGVTALGVVGPWLDLLPGRIDPTAVVTRPSIALAVAAYLLVFVALWRRADLSDTLDGRWLVFALYLAFLDHVLVAPFWVGFGTGIGTVDALLELLTYVIAGTGVLVSTTVLAREQEAAVARFRGEARERARIEAELARHAARLTHANEELAQYAYLASHDLQEPLRMVTNYLQLIERRYSDALDDDGREFMEYAVDGARRMKRLTNDLLMYSRVGDDEAEGARGDAGEAFDVALQNLAVLVEETGAEVTRGPLPEVPIDDVRLTQLFQNLVGNAIKFRREGVPPRVRAEATREEASWRFTLTDNGIGIDPKHADRVFGVFQRLHGREAFPGSGIGLAMCRKIVERHGGRIGFESAPGEGATFVWTVPLQAPTAAERDDDADPELRNRVSSLVERARELI